MTEGRIAWLGVVRPRYRARLVTGALYHLWQAIRGYDQTVQWYCDHGRDDRQGVVSQAVRTRDLTNKFSSDELAT